MSNNFSKVVKIMNPGEAEEMTFCDFKLPEVGLNEVQIRHKAIGLNFIDIYHRSGVYPLEMPTGLGMEGSGVIEKVGESIKSLKVGDRVAYASTTLGSYSEARVMPATQLCKLPDSISFEQGAAIMLKGLTVQYLFHNTTPLAKGDIILFHAAAGGVGLIACQWAKSEGINLIATAGSDEKCNLAMEYGAVEAINYKKDDFVERVKDLTNGEGVDVVMDSVGKDTFEGSLDCLKPLGMMISFGNSSGKVPPFDIGLLQSKGSLKLTRPTLFNPHLNSSHKCNEMSAKLFKKIQSKDIKITIGQTFPFERIVEAHKALENSETKGSTVITL